MPYNYINKTKLSLSIGFKMAISYPLEIEENPDFYRSMIEFKILDTEPAALTTLDAKPSMQSASSNAGGGGFSFGNFSLSSFFDLLDPASQGKQSLPNGSAGSALGREVITPADGFEDIKIYMPVSFNQTDTFSYQNTELGAAGAIGAAALRGGQNIPGAAGAALSEGFAGITDTLDAVLGSGQLGQIGAARIAQKVGSVSATGQAAIEQAAQVVANPNIRASFKSVGLRKFQFLFNFIPKNPAEADAVDAIIYNFRKAGYPEELPAGGDISIAFKYPQLFRIVPKVRTDRGFEVNVNTPIKYCYLESISVNTNPIGNNTFHADGHAIQTDLSLSFVEYRTLSRKDIVMGYKEPTEEQGK
jgi:hypothetical protein